MKKLAINIDWIIRDIAEQFDTLYRKRYVHNASLVGMNDDMTVKEMTEEEEEELTQKIEKMVKDKITYPVDTFDLLNHYKFEPTLAADGTTMLTPRQHLEKFMYDDFTYQIFAQAPEIEKAGEIANRIQQFGIAHNLYETVLVCKLKGKSIASTFAFLSKINCRIKNIHFVDEDYEKWEHADILVDVSPETIQNKPEGKIVVKINHSGNQWDTADYAFDDLKSLYNEDFLRKIATVDDFLI